MANIFYQKLKCLLSVASNIYLIKLILQLHMNKKSNLLLGFVKLLLYFCTEFPEFRCENALCVAGCYHCDIAANSRRQNHGEFALCVSRHVFR